MTELERSDIDNLVTVLFGNDAMTFTDIIGGEDKFGTGPVRNCFIVMAHTDLCTDLQRVDGFFNVAQYPDQRDIKSSEFGTVGQTRWLLSSVGSVTPNASNLGANVYNCFMAGRESYASVFQDNYSARFVYRPPQFTGPLGLTSTAGWTMAFVPRITNDAWLGNLRCTLA